MPSYISRPNVDVTAGWTETPAGDAFSTVDDAVSQPTVAGTADYCSTSTNAASFAVGFENVAERIPPGERVTGITVWVYGYAGASSSVGFFLYDLSGATAYTGGSVTDTSYGWESSTTWAGNLSSAQLDGLWVDFVQTGTNESRIAAAYLEFTTEVTAEQIVLDPPEVSGGRTPLTLTADPIDVLAEGIDWGDAAIEEYLADQRIGSVAVDSRRPNRTISIPLKLIETYDVSFAKARAMLQQKVGLIQTEHQGWLKRVTANGGTVYADLVSAALTLPGSWDQARQKRQADVQLTLEALPDFYGDEIALTDHTETSATELIFTETELRGDAPARVRVVVDDDEGQVQKGLVWAFRSRYYDASPFAKTAYDAEALTPLDIAGKTALSGASGGTVVRHGTLSTDWTPVLGTYLNHYTFGTGHLTHQGTYRMLARVYSSSGTTVRLRSVYDVGDLTNPSSNDSWRMPGGSAFYIADLGELQLQPVPLGNHRWIGQIQATGDAGGEAVSIDKVWVVNVDDGFGICRAASENDDISFSSFTAQDQFNQTAGTLNAKTLPVGGTWQTTGGTADYSVESTGKTAQRTTTGESPAFTGARYARPSGSSGTTQRVSVDFKRDVLPTSGYQILQGVLGRYTDANNWLMAAVYVYGSPLNYGQLLIGKNKASTYSTIYSGPLSTWYASLALWYRVGLLVDADGRWEAQIGTAALPNIWRVRGQDTDLATGGALASGQTGIIDENTGSTVVTRNYDNFTALTPAADAAVFASQTAQITSQGAYRLDAGGTAYGPISSVQGDLPRLPPPGMEQRPVEVFLKLSRGDLGALPDVGIDNLSAKLYYRPSWLFAASIDADELRN